MSVPWFYGGVNSYFFNLRVFVGMAALPSQPRDITWHVKQTKTVIHTNTLRRRRILYVDSKYSLLCVT